MLRASAGVSNTGYDILGKLAEHIGGKPLAAPAARPFFRSLGDEPQPRRDQDNDRQLYAQGYEAADELPFALGVPLAPAAWVDTTSAAGSIASTADDMVRFLRTVANAVQGTRRHRTSPEAGKVFTAHAVPSDEPALPTATASCTWAAVNARTSTTQAGW